MRALVRTAEKVITHDASLLILGETGSGKDYLAEAIHACGPRRTEPFVRIACASLPADLFESELFGFEKGAYTDATARKAGRLELARRGTLYFNQIAALAPNLQAKLLRAVQDRSFSRLGGNQTIALGARFVSSTSLDVDALLESGGLRPDLFYRLNVVTLRIPPLRDRREDIPRLARQFLRRAGGQAGRNPLRSISSAAMAMLVEHSWPGNVRELRNAIERAAILESSSDGITIDSLPLERFLDPADMIDQGARQRWTLAELEARYIREILRRTGRNYSQAARILGINRKTLLEKRRRFGL